MLRNVKNKTAIKCMQCPLSVALYFHGGYLNSFYFFICLNKFIIIVYYNHKVTKTDLPVFLDDFT